MSNPPVTGIRHVYLFLLIVLCGIAVRLFWIQILKGENYRQRGYRDRRLQDAATNVIAHGAVEPGRILGTLRVEGLEQIVSQRRLRQQLIVLDRMGAFRMEEGKVVLAPDAIRMRNPRLTLGGPPAGEIRDRRGRILAEPDIQRGRRRYPYGAATFHVVGNRTPVYQSRGLEALWDADTGDIMHTTLDAELQARAFERLEGRPGAVVMLAVETGDVIVMTSYPSFDPNEEPGRRWILAAKDEDTQPFLNRATGQLYPPGSTMKVIVASAALTNGFDPKRELVCTGERYGIKEHEAHGRLNLFSAFWYSCNSYFGWLGVEMGVDSIREMAARFGFGQQWTLAPGMNSVPSSVPPGAIPYKGLLAQIAIGQYDVRATPLQMALVALVVANDGELMAPRLLADTPVQTLGRAVSTEVAHSLRSMMLGVMREGSGNWIPRIYHRANEEGVEYLLAYRGKATDWIEIGGKTGTAETGREEELPHSWFIGFAPADSPRYAVSVLVEHGDWGSVTAGPIAAELLAAALAQDEANATLRFSKALQDPS